MYDGPTPDVAAFKAKVRAMLHSICAVDVEIHIGAEVAEVFFWLDGKYYRMEPLYVLGDGGPQVERILREVEMFVDEHVKAAVNVKGG